MQVCGFFFNARQKMPIQVKKIKNKNKSLQLQYIM